MNDTPVIAKDILKEWITGKLKEPLPDLIAKYLDLALSTQRSEIKARLEDVATISRSRIVDGQRVCFLMIDRDEALAAVEGLEEEK